MLRGLGAKPAEVLKARDFLAVFDDEAAVRALQPDFATLRRLDCLGIIATAPEKDVTGSAHCTLIPFWAGRLGKTRLFARQASFRGGELHCQLAGDRVKIGGQAVTYLRGEIFLPGAGAAITMAR